MVWGVPVCHLSGSRRDISAGRPCSEVEGFGSQGVCVRIHFCLLLAGDELVVSVGLVSSPGRAGLECWPRGLCEMTRGGGACANPRKAEQAPTSFLGQASLGPFLPRFSNFHLQCCLLALNSQHSEVSVPELIKCGPFTYSPPVHSAGTMYCRGEGGV